MVIGSEYAERSINAAETGKEMMTSRTGICTCQNGMSTGRSHERDRSTRTEGERCSHERTLGGWGFSGKISLNEERIGEETGRRVSSELVLARLSRGEEGVSGKLSLCHM